MIEKLLNSNNSIPGMLASVCVLLACQLLFRAGEFLWKMKKEKDKLSEESVQKLAEAMKQNSVELFQLRSQMKSLEMTFAEFPKFTLDIRRLFFAVKTMAGEQWPQIRDDMMKDVDF